MLDEVSPAPVEEPDPRLLPLVPEVPMLLPLVPEVLPIDPEPVPSPPEVEPLPLIPLPAEVPPAPADPPPAAPVPLRKSDRGTAQNKSRDDRGYPKISPHLTSPPRHQGWISS